MANTTPGAPAGAPTAGLRPPEGRYGSAEARAGRARRGKRIYYGLIAVVLALVGLIAYLYVSKSDVSGELQAFDVVSKSRVDITVEVSKPSDKTASCTVRSRDYNGNEVGRMTFTVPKGSGDWKGTVHLRTTSLGTTGELVGCS